MVRNGVPFDKAMGMDAAEFSAYRMSATERRAFCIVFGEFEGNKFDWITMTWEEPK